MTRVDPFIRYEVDANGCWLWTGRISDEGYAYCSKVPAHRVVYELLVEPIPEGLELDHLCRVRHCVNPAHMEPVTRAVNNARSTSPSALNAVKTHCANGHPYDQENTYRGYRGRRNCRACNRGAQRRRKARLRGAP